MKWPWSKGPGPAKARPSPQRTAYLVVVIDVSEIGRPVIKDVGIYSESGYSLTNINGDISCVTIMEWSVSTYQGAREDLREEALVRYPWTAPFFKARNERTRI